MNNLNIEFVVDPSDCTFTVISSNDILLKSLADSLKACGIVFRGLLGHKNKVTLKSVKFPLGKQWHNPASIEEIIHVESPKTSPIIETISREDWIRWAHQEVSASMELGGLGGVPAIRATGSRVLVGTPTKHNDYSDCVYIHHEQLGYFRIMFSNYTPPTNGGI